MAVDLLGYRLMSKDKPSKFCHVCPRRLDLLPDESCSLAMDRVNAIRSEGPPDKRNMDIDALPGCPWYVASSDHHYCFWVYARDIHGSPVSEKEICDLLMISSSQLDRVQESALERLRRPENRGNLIALAELVAELANRQGLDLTVYLPDDFKNALKEAMEPKPANVSGDIAPAKAVVKRKAGSMPLHRDGKKVDLFGLYSNKTRQKDNRKRPDAEAANKKKDSEKE